MTLLGSAGGPALTVRAVCRHAGLTERYFYESFSDRDEFVRAVYDDVCNRAMTALMSAGTPREAVERFVALMVDDPVRGRVLLLAPEVEPVLIHSGAEWMPSFIELLQSKLITVSDPVLQKMMATGLIGALTALFTAYLDGRLPASRAVHRLLRRTAPQSRAELSAGDLTRLAGHVAGLLEFSRLALLRFGLSVGELLLVGGADGTAFRAADRVAWPTGSRERVVAVQVQQHPSAGLLPLESRKSAGSCQPGSR